MEPTYGFVRIAGIDTGLEPAKARSLIGYMPDLAPVIGDLKVWEFLDLFAHCHGLHGKERSMRVDECLDVVKLGDKRNALCKTLSRGMTQRVVLAKTLLHRPRLLLLDEPASGMDPLARIDLKDSLERIAAEGATIVLSSHILSELAEMVSSVAFMHNGRLHGSGAVADVVDSIKQLRAEVLIELLDDPQACLQWLESRGLKPAIDKRRPRVLHVELDGGEQAQADLLGDLVRANFRVRAFSTQRSSLEDVMRSISAAP
jgi:ABC-2 type transport system ATP-binding protein